jgi:hypothetical protein
MAQRAHIHLLLPLVLLQVGVFRRGRYAAGKKVGKGNVANTGDQVKKGQTLGYVEQLGTFVEVKVSWRLMLTHASSVFLLCGHQQYSQQQCPQQQCWRV